MRYQRFTPRSALFAFGLVVASNACGGGSGGDPGYQSSGIGAGTPVHGGQPSNDSLVPGFGSGSDGDPDATSPSTKPFSASNALPSSLGQGGNSSQGQGGGPQGQGGGGPQGQGGGGPQGQGGGGPQGQGGGGPQGQGGTSGGNCVPQCEAILTACPQKSVSAAQCPELCQMASADCQNCVLGAGTNCGGVSVCIASVCQGGQSGSGGSSSEGPGGSGGAAGAPEGPGGSGGVAGSPEGPGGSGGTSGGDCPGQCTTLANACPNLGLPPEQCPLFCQAAPPACQACVLGAGNNCDVAATCQPMCM